MKKSRFILLLIGVSLLFAVQAHATDFLLKGVEIAKGVDVRAVRYGTSFVGEAYDETLGTTVGYWSITLNYRGAAEVGVCGGENDIVLFLITVYFTSGDLAGNKVVLGMKSKQGVPIFWDYSDTPCVTLGGCGCNCPSGNQTLCDGQVESNLAQINNISLSPKLGTTLKNIKSASLEGWLCHTYPVVPRVSGTLTIDFM